LWKGMLGSSREGLEAYEQLAIHYERYNREPHRAAEVSRDALNELQKAKRLGTIAAAAYQKMRAQFEKRLARVERKAGNLPLKSISVESEALAPESNRTPRVRPSHARIG
jgi:hypothetical protein